MRDFSCAACGNTTYFENRNCLKCGAKLGFVTETQTLEALAPAGGNAWTLVSGASPAFRFCANARSDVCNWLVDAGSSDRFCKACRHNRLVPNPALPQTLAHWRAIGAAQRHLFYSFLRWNLPAPTRQEDPDGGLLFDFLEDTRLSDGTLEKPMTGHDDGLITIRAAEADDAERETLRAQMHEPYRTMLGHFRHECGHFIWNQMVRDGGLIAECRAVFGDDSQDYGEALQRYYRQGPPANWQNQFISEYASSHPWEDFAETFAHCLHIIDTLEMARSHMMRLSVCGEAPREIAVDPYAESSFETLANLWVPLSITLNSLHHSMGERPLYPFILTPVVRTKLSFVHRIITRQIAADGQRAVSAAEVEAA
ncbi:zinc-binding metallopeptidase family protein [Asticcacaulis taihuensis]|uniref:zinc-binding metallopeptidase family protein n=1 Tax=Asticcacaulis taihuensis TaxID=260084 RepID=UPI0026F2FB68|nr:putative zinc-binding peptidase [Asticcacaulis taihuensis]